MCLHPIGHQAQADICLMSVVSTSISSSHCFCFNSGQTQVSTLLISLPPTYFPYFHLKLLLKYCPCLQLLFSEPWKAPCDQRPHLYDLAPDWKYSSIKFIFLHNASHFSSSTSLLTCSIPLSLYQLNSYSSVKAQLQFSLPLKNLLPTPTLRMESYFWLSAQSRGSCNCLQSSQIRVHPTPAASTTQPEFDPSALVPCLPWPQRSAPWACLQKRLVMTTSRQPVIGKISGLQ